MMVSAVRESIDRHNSTYTTGIQLYDEGVRFSTGDCGPNPDDELLEVSTVLGQLEDTFEGVERANMQYQNRKSKVETRIDDDLRRHVTHRGGRSDR